MGNGAGDEAPVTWGRYAAAHQATIDRLDDLEAQNGRQFTRLEANERAIAAAEENRRALDTRVSRLFEVIDQRRDRTWKLGTILLTSLLLPLLVVGVSVWLHLR